MFKKMGHIRSRLAVTLALAVVASAGTALISSSPAHAALKKGPFYVHTSVNTLAHTQALVGAPTVGTMYTYNQLKDLCYVRGDVWNGSNKWDLVYNLGTGVAGFISQTELRSDDGSSVQDYECYFGNPDDPEVPYDNNHIPWAPGFTYQHAQAILNSQYTGPADYTHSLLSLCWVTGDDYHGFTGWELIYNRNTGVAGFINNFDLGITGSRHECYFD